MAYQSVPSSDPGLPDARCWAGHLRAPRDELGAWTGCPKTMKGNAGKLVQLFCQAPALPPPPLSSPPTTCSFWELEMNASGRGSGGGRVPAHCLRVSCVTAEAALTQTR